MDKILVSVALVLLAICIAAPVFANAQLVGTSFGFPTIEQTGTTTAFNRDTAAATDNEAFALSFPTTADSEFTSLSGLPSGGAFDLAFPTIAQTSDQTQVLTHTDFSNTNELAAFSYPFVGVGGVALPGLGFGL